MALNPPDSWAYHKQIDITDAGSVSADYQMMLTIYSGHGDDNTATGEIYCNNLCKDFPDDIRFGTTSNSYTATELYQWIESSDAVSAVIWVKMVAANTIYLFIGRSGTDNFSDGDNTFLFFDDFPGVALDLSKWDVFLDNPTVSGGNLVLDNDDGLTSDNAYGPYNIRIRSRAKLDEQDQHLCAMNEDNDGTETDYFIIKNSDAVDWNTDLLHVGCQASAGGTTEKNRNVACDNLVNFNIFEITWENGHCYYYQNSVELAHHTTGINNGASYVWFRAWDSSQESTMWCDWVSVGKHAPTEPSWSAFGAWKKLPSKLLHLDPGPHPRSRATFIPSFTEKWG